MSVKNVPCTSYPTPVPICVIVFVPTFTEQR